MSGIVPNDVFRALCTFETGRCARHTDQSTVGHYRFLGAGRAINRFRGALRKSDAVTVLGPNDVLALFPSTSPSRHVDIASRLMQTLSTPHHAKVPVYDRAFSLPEESELVEQLFQAMVDEDALIAEGRRNGKIGEGAS